MRMETKQKPPSGDVGKRLNVELVFRDDSIFYRLFVFGRRHALVVLSEYAAEVVTARDSYLICYLGDRAIGVAEYLFCTLDAVVVKVIYGSCLHI